MIDLYPMIWPVIRAIDPEKAHGMAIAALKAGIVPRLCGGDDPILRTEAWGLSFPNPVGMAAGFDKNGEVADALLGQGFGHVEIGSVTPKPQPGNPKPRMFRLIDDRALINRMGFNSAGADVVARNLAGRAAKEQRRGIVGVNLGKNKTSTDAAADYVAGVEKLAPLADYLVVNVSSPNTPGLRALQGRAELETLLASVKEALGRTVPDSAPPLLLKIAPDLTDDDKADIAAVVLDLGIDGLIATNTTIDRPSDLRSPHRNETGGLSGVPLMGPSTGVLSDIYRLTGGRIPIVGVGGIASGRDAYAKIRAGATMVQFYSAMVYAGPGLVVRINRDLAALLKADGFASVADAVGADHRGGDGGGS
ncbi:MAG: quinone-dependent dihydroorotate dehydrogenase [Rhodospirillales bacterium]|nr:quinone-dependent dihydroorotate dehydrogenase [Rhodospirillales bacterium]MCW8863180.1 quinone-dependent dihydroorotate dehydrogenase [Rhodospirillales bacterium]MCW8952491.1 quinone-dependent dihydroorotate dehydrogenase [Rhodospirillales bacterium]MCW9003372.1 quinone-dependent dihydroorotate dehydrogenase [Rhodospirillales bacterium]